MSRILKYPCLVLDHDDTTVNSTAIRSDFSIP